MVQECLVVTAHAERVNYRNSELWVLISQSHHQITYYDNALIIGILPTSCRTVFHSQDLWIRRATDKRIWSADLGLQSTELGRFPDKMKRSEIL